ncbi:hypothetical protein ACFE04_025144 [Oxalis oulophora]
MELSSELNQVNEEHVGLVMEALSHRRGEVVDMGPVPGDIGRIRLSLTCPSRGLVGYRSVFSSDTRGTRFMHRAFLRYEKYRGPLGNVRKGVLLRCSYSSEFTVCVVRLSIQIVSRSLNLLIQKVKVLLEISMGSRSQADQGLKNRSLGSFSTLDLNWNASTRTGTSNNVDMSLIGHNGNRALFLSSHNPQSADAKQIIKYAMLKHDAEFQNQVHELHRIYKRQVELMNEKKEDEYKHQLQMQSSRANSVLCQNSIQQALKQWGTPNLPGVKHSENQVAAESSLSHYPYSAQISCSAKETHLLETNSECRKSGKRILDLQLPAEAYLDFEKEKCSPRKNVSKSSLEVAGSSSVSQVSDPLLRIPKFLFDLNTPFVLEEDVNAEQGDVREPVNQETFTENSFMSDIREPVNQDIFTENSFMPGEDIEPNQAHVQLLKSDLSHESNPPLSDISTSKPDIPQKELDVDLSQRNHVDERQGVRKIVLALPCMAHCQKKGKGFKPTMERSGLVECKKNGKKRKGKTLSECEDRENNEKSGVVDLNSDLGEQVTINKLAVSLLDLNSYANDDDENESSPAAFQEKHSGVCGSDENPAMISENEDGDLPEEYLAAKALVKMSLSQIRSQAKDIPWLQPLYWFAETVSSKADKRSHEGSPVQKEEKFLPNRGFQKGDNPGRLSGTWKVQRRSARRQRNNFQMEVLPILATVSSYEEATEDLQMIRGPIEDSAVKLGKRVLTRGTKSSGNLVFKEQTESSETVTKERSVVDWGRINKRRRSLRRRVN